VVRAHPTVPTNQQLSLKSFRHRDRLAEAIAEIAASRAATKKPRHPVTARLVLAGKLKRRVFAPCEFAARLLPFASCYRN
jgi:hypothetical protein